jgi:hypothetical protein
MTIYEVRSVDELGTVELIAKCVNSATAEDLLFRLKEGDDKHSPCFYFINETEI